jgi:hypothetical protein
MDKVMVETSRIRTRCFERAGGRGYQYGWSTTTSPPAVSGRT